MKVLFLGAGASMPAGYPAAAKLIDHIRATVQGADVMTARAWERFESFRNNSQGQLGRILRSPNPEVVLTLPDLYRASLQAEDQDRWTRVMAAYRSNNGEGVDRVNAEWSQDDPVREEMLVGARAADDLLTCLWHALAWWHYQDSKEESVARRAYMTHLLANLRAGDVVITTNWDTLVERSLLDALRWTPADGYGFPVQLTHGFSRADGRRPPLPDWFPSSSEVQVLKLHGSLGWRLSASQRIYLEYAQFLQYMSVSRDGDFVVFRDAMEDTLGRPRDDPMLIRPSFLKSLEGQDLQRVWVVAAAALNRASQVRVIGSSLADADVGLRVLLNPLKGRMQAGEVAVAVENPDPQARERWENFLGENAVVRGLSLGK